MKTLQLNYLNNKKAILIILTLSFIILSAVITIKNSKIAYIKNDNDHQFEAKNVNKSEVLSNTTDTNFHEVKFYDDRDFLKSINQAKGCNLSYLPRGMITPHHTLPSFILSNMYCKLASFNNTNNEIKQIIIIGPNHENTGNKNIITSKYNWKTKYGIIKSDYNNINKLLETNLVYIDENVLPNDHAVVSSMPYIKYYLPNAKITPILLKSKTSEVEVRLLANELSKLFKQNTLIVAAVDFSHYLTRDQAKEKDKITNQLMATFNIQKLMSLNNNDYLDSPASIATLLITLQNLNSTNGDIMYHLNSGELLNKPGIETTSYFGVFYY